MDGEMEQDHRPRYLLRQALTAIVASFLAIGAIAAVSGDESSVVVPTDGSQGTIASVVDTAAGAAPETDPQQTVPLDSTRITDAASDTSEASDTSDTSDTSGTLASTATTTPAETGATTAVAPVATGLPTIEATAYAVYDATSATWLAESQADTALPVGSVMKLLTSYVVLQAGDLGKTVTVPALEMDIEESAIGLYTGEQLPRDVLLRAMLIVSANDAARTLAIDVGGTTEGFVAQMNAAAQQLGLSSTVAANPIGLDADGAHSSARDMIELATILMQDPTFAAAVAKPSANLHGQTFAATNKLLTTYDGATGVKTGHTTQAGYCLIGSATRDGRTIFVAVLGSPSDQQRLDDSAELLDWAFSHS